MFELTDNMLFDADVRYTEILNAFDVMISDYSSIVFDYLLLDRPVIYLIPDYEEYRSQRGFVFRNIDSYMPGDKAFDFRQMLDALQRVFDGADGYQEPGDLSCHKDLITGITNHPKGAWKRY